MRIGYLVPEFPGQTHIFFWREVEALRRAGDEIFLLSTKPPPAGATTHEFALAAISETKYLLPPSPLSLGRWAISGFRGLRRGTEYIARIDDQRWTERARHLAALFSAAELVRWAKQNRIDHVHGHSCANSAHILALAYRMGGTPYSLTLHGDLLVYGSDHLLKMEQATAVFAVGEHLRQQLLRLGVDDKKIVTTFMGVNSCQLADIAGSARRMLSGELRLVTVARLDPSKGHLHALAAIARARSAGLNVRYSIVGQGYFRETIASKVEMLNLTDCVELCGTLSERQVFALLSDSDAFLLSSTGTGEAWPVSVMEAMGAGLPVICSEIGATSEMITHGVDGILVRQGDEDGIFEAIRRLAQHPDLREQLGKAARKTAIARFDVDVSARRLRRALIKPQPESVS